MTRRVFSVVALLISLLAVPISRASADPIVVIAGGSSVIVPDNGHFSAVTAHLEGTQQFLADLSFTLENGSILCDPCGAPGSIFNMSTFLNTQSDGGGTVHLAGVTYQAAGQSQEDNSAAVLLELIAVPVVLPPSTSASAVLTTRFKLGDISGLSLTDDDGFHSVHVVERPGHCHDAVRPHQGPRKRRSVEFRQPALRFHADDARAGNADAHQRRLGRCRNSREKTPRPENASSVVNQHTDGVIARPSF